ncbi:MAG: phosphate/phosphite/phosphonate ABC transporter substrate-binding protein [Coriobacteriia bacterium]|nr:phosphate/phosphite/phosphonate ABC transporter substrate-binding protein [Coriobacteriia bacterium]
MPSDSQSRDVETQSGPEHSASNRWLLAAIVATLVCVALILVMFLGLQRSPFTETLSEGVTGTPTEAERLVFAVARTPGGPSEWSNWARVIKYVSEELGRPVSIRYVAKEEAATDVILEEGIDVAFVCAHHYLHLRDEGAFQGLCVPVIDGMSTCCYELIVHNDDSARSLEDLAGSAVAVSDKSSLGGLSYLSHLCRERGLEPTEFFGELLIGETQESNLRDLSSGNVRATVVNTAQIADWDLSQFKEIEQSPPVGCPPVIISTDIDSELRERLVEVFLAFDAAASLPDDSHVDGFVAFDADDYAFAEEIRGACGHHHGE